MKRVHTNTTRERDVFSEYTPLEKKLKKHFVNNTMNTVKEKREAALKHSVDILFVLFSVVIPNTQSNELKTELILGLHDVVPYVIRPAANALIAENNGKIRKAQRVALEKKYFRLAEKISHEIVVERSVWKHALFAAVSESKIVALDWLYKSVLNNGLHTEECKQKRHPSFERVLCDDVIGRKLKHRIFLTANEHGTYQDVLTTFDILYGTTRYDQEEMESLIYTLLLNGYVKSTKLVLKRGCGNVLCPSGARCLLELCRARTLGDGIHLIEDIMKKQGIRECTTYVSTPSFESGVEVITPPRKRTTSSTNVPRIKRKHRK